MKINIASKINNGMRGKGRSICGDGNVDLPDTTRLAPPFPRAGRVALIYRCCEARKPFRRRTWLILMVLEPPIEAMGSIEVDTVKFAI